MLQKLARESRLAHPSDLQKPLQLHRSPEVRQKIAHRLAHEALPSRDVLQLEGVLRKQRRLPGGRPRKATQNPQQLPQPPDAVIPDQIQNPVPRRPSSGATKKHPPSRIAEQSGQQPRFRKSPERMSRRKIPLQ